jgi:translocation and assembly module TamB
MKRRTKYTIAFLTAVVLAAGGGGAWLCGTSGGTRALLQVVSRLTPLGIKAATVEGTLLEGLRLSGVRVPLSDGEVRIERFRLDWRPLGLLLGRFQAKSLVLEGVRVRDDSRPVEKPPGIDWPRVSVRQAAFMARIEELRVEDFVYRRLREEPVVVTRLAADARWRAGVLSVEGLAVASPAGSVSGSLSAGFLRRFLKFDVTAVPATPAAPASPGPVKVSGELEPVSRTELSLKSLQVTRPGRAGKATASGAVRIEGKEPLFDLKAGVEGVDLRGETGVQTDISGRILFTGGVRGYRGSFDLANRGDSRHAARLSGLFAGDAAGIELTSLRGALLGGSVEGDLALGWKEGFAASGALRGRNIDPSRIDPRWKGSVNADLRGDASRGKSGALRAEVAGAILRSNFQGEPFSGELSVSVEGKDVTFRRLFLRGKGFDVGASGNLARGLSFSAKVADLSVLLPDAAGEVSAAGRLRWEGSGLPAGSVTARAHSLAAWGSRVSSARLTAETAGGSDPSATLRGSLQGFGYRSFAADSAALSFDGTRERHSLSATLASRGASIDLALRGGYRDKGWEGEIVRLDGRDEKGEWRLVSPASLALSPGRAAVSPLEVKGTGGEALRLSGEIGREPLRGHLGGSFRNLLLARLNPWLKGMRLDGSGSGSLGLNLFPRERFTLSGEVAAEGGITATGKERIGFRKGLVRVDWGESGLRGSTELALSDGGSCSGAFSSPSPPRLAFPASGKGEFRCDNVSAALLRPWLPANVAVDGRISGRLAAGLLPGKRLEADGKATLAGGTLTIDDGKGRITTAMRTLDVTWGWRGESLSGGFTLEMAKWGGSRGEFRLPLPARLPTAVDRNGPLMVRMAGEVRELGVVTAFFPGLVREGHGELSYDLRAGGTLGAPALSGSVRLAKAGAYVPSAGVTLSAVELNASLDGDRIGIDSFRAVSEAGHLEGTASLRLKDRRVVDYRGSIQGENFEALRLPDLRASVTPRLEFTGTPERVTLSGDILIPELRITGEARRASVRTSGDVIIIDAPVREPERRIEVALNVGVRLGEHVTVKTRGIDARLTGRVDLSGDIRNLTSRGEIRVAEGDYRAYGLGLKIVRGRVFYAGGPVTAPTLDILALKTVGEVKTGVTVGGTVQSPVVKLYSEPSMPDVDILAYMVLGHPLGGDKEQAGLLARAAGALLSAGQSVALQDQLKSRLGISTLELQTAGEKGTGHMGYKPLASTPGTAAAAAGATTNGSMGGLSETMLTVGKYLTPKIYVSYGRSIFTGANLFRLRYDISKRWQVETQTGNESGADLYYKIEFN